jgi:HAD superfamily phosphatase (TIGR01681 family)
MNRYKIFVFDLDNTLYLHNHEDTDYVEKYHRDVKKAMIYLKENYKKIYIATHNSSPSYLLKILGIESYLDGVIAEKQDLHPFLNNIHEYTSKLSMIMEILENNPFCAPRDVVFFDDSIYNINQVKNFVDSVYVDAKIGVSFKKLKE